MAVAGVSTWGRYVKVIVPCILLDYYDGMATGLIKLGNGWMKVTCVTEVWDDVVGYVAEPVSERVAEYCDLLMSNHDSQLLVLSNLDPELDSIDESFMDRSNHELASTASGFIIAEKGSCDIMLFASMTDRIRKAIAGAPRWDSGQAMAYYRTVLAEEIRGQAARE